MKIVKVTFSDGDSLVTNINATFEEAEEYYLGNIFNTGTEDDHMVRTIKVEEV